MIESHPDAHLGWPEVAVLPVTYFCNASCDMCALGDLNQRQRLSDDRLVEIFADPAISSTLRAINFTGGEPTVRRDLPHLVGRLLDACPALESYSLNSNGMLKTSADTIRRVIGEGQARGKKAYVFISLDGIGPLHDEIRGVPGAYEATVGTIDALRALRIPSTDLKLGISATATRKNIEHLDAVLDFALDRDLVVSFTWPLVTGVYMNNLERADRFWSEPALVERFATFLDRLEDYPDHVSPPFSFYKSLQETLRGGRRTAPCIFRRGGFFLEPDATLRPCWRSEELVFGSLDNESFGEIWTGERRRELLRTIEESFCSTCPSPCYVGFPSPLLDAPTA